MIKAPFSVQQIAALNDFQMWSSRPVKCKYDHPPLHALGQKGVMVATFKGFICPYCDHKQDWAPNEMVKRVSLFQAVDVPKEYQL